VPGSPAILEAVDQHLLAGSQREKDPKTGELGDYVEGCDNHLLLADAYSRLAEANGGSTTVTSPTASATVRRGSGARRGRAMPT
jgi:hypothetical protein